MKMLDCKKCIEIILKVFQVYKTFGYKIIRPTYPVPTVKMVAEPTCSEVKKNHTFYRVIDSFFQIFSGWREVSEQPQPTFPPQEIPEDRLHEFLLNNYTALGPVFFAKL